MKRKTRETEPPNEAALAAELKAAEARWQELKRRARVAKVAAKDGKKALKRLRKQLLVLKGKDAARKQITRAKRSRSQDQPARPAAAKRLRIAGTPEPRVRPKRKRPTLRKSSTEPLTPEVQTGTTVQDTTEPHGGHDDGT